MQAVSAMFEGNVPLQTIMQKKALDLIDGLSQEEIDEVLDFEEQKRNNPVAQLVQLRKEVRQYLPQFHQRLQFLRHNNDIIL